MNLAPEPIIISFRHLYAIQIFLSTREWNTKKCLWTFWVYYLDFFVYYVNWTVISQNGRTGTIVYGLGPKMNGNAGKKRIPIDVKCQLKKSYHSTCLSKEPFVNSMYPSGEYSFSK